MDKRVSIDIHRLLDLSFDLVHHAILSKAETIELLLSLLILKRMDSTISDIKEGLDLGSDPEIVKYVVKVRTGSDFYNTFKYSLRDLAELEGSKLDSLLDYIDNYNYEVRSLLDNLYIKHVLVKLSKEDIWFNKVINSIVDINLSKEYITKEEVDDLLVYIYNKFDDTQRPMDTPDDIIKLMTSILFNRDDVNAYNNPPISDYSFGIGSLLIESYKYLTSINNKADPLLLGMEGNSFKYSFAKLRMMLLGINTSSIDNSSCIINPGDISVKTRYSLMVPPIEGASMIKTYKDYVIDESKWMKEYNRFEAGLPSVNDGFYLYLLHQIFTLNYQGNYGGKAAIISTPHSLVPKKGNINKGVRLIRKWLLDEDLIETIIKLPNNLFNHTDITFYLWIINKNKENNSSKLPREGTLQFLNASTFYDLCRRKENCKSKFISDENLNKILSIYNSYEYNSYSKLINTNEIESKEDWTRYFHESQIH